MRPVSSTAAMNPITRCRSQMAAASWSEVVCHTYGGLLSVFSEELSSLPPESLGKCYKIFPQGTDFKNLENSAKRYPVRLRKELIQRKT